MFKKFDLGTSKLCGVFCCWFHWVRDVGTFVPLRTNEGERKANWGFLLFFHRCCQLGSEVYSQGSVQPVHKVQERWMILEAAEVFILPTSLGRNYNKYTLCTLPLCLMLYFMHSFYSWCGLSVAVCMTIPLKIMHVYSLVSWKCVDISHFYQKILLSLLFVIINKCSFDKGNIPLTNKEGKHETFLMAGDSLIL